MELIQRQPDWRQPRKPLDRAVALDPNLPEIHLALGYYRYYGLRDFTGALAEFQLAEKSLPNHVGVLRAIGLIQRRFGHWDEVIAVMRRVFVELDPRNIESAGNPRDRLRSETSFFGCYGHGRSHSRCRPCKHTDDSGSRHIVFGRWEIWKRRTQLLANAKLLCTLRAHQAFR